MRKRRTNGCRTRTSRSKIYIYQEEQLNKRNTRTKKKYSRNDDEEKKIETCYTRKVNVNKIKVTNTKIN